MNYLNYIYFRNSWKIQKFAETTVHAGRLWNSAGPRTNSAQPKSSGKPKKDKGPRPCWIGWLGLAQLASAAQRAGQRASRAGRRRAEPTGQPSGWAGQAGPRGRLADRAGQAEGPAAQRALRKCARRGAEVQSNLACVAWVLAIDVQQKSLLLMMLLHV